jgi:hypothetical protein
MRGSTYLNSIFPLREMHRPLRRLLQHPCLILLRQPSPNSPGLLRSEVEREVFLVLVEEAELCALVGVDDGEDLGNRLAEIVAVGYVTLVDSPGCLAGKIGSSKGLGWRMEGQTSL